MELDANGLEVLEADESLRLLATRSFGRIALSSAALPVILPVNYIVVGDDIVIRTRRGTNLAAATRRDVVAFEVDDVDPSTGIGWSVMVQGLVRELHESAALDLARAAPLARWLDPDDCRHVAISIDVISGRRVGPAVERSGGGDRPTHHAAPARA